MPELKAYAEPAPVEKAAQPVPERKITVAEFRNKVNPVTKYYDNWTAESLMSDPYLSKLDKICVILGIMPTKIHGTTGGWIDELFEKLKKEVC